MALPVWWPGIDAVMLSALLVGGTFMVITLIGMQEARALAGVDAAALMAAMTTAFAAGQIAGPLCVSYLVGVTTFSEGRCCSPASCCSRARERSRAEA